MNDVIGKAKSDLDTPCLVIDKNILQANLKKMQQEVNAAKKNLRPHVKTHKCITICKEQIKQGAIGIAAAKVSEALVLAEHGLKNTLITSPVVTSAKIELLLKCLEKDNELTVVIDNLENAKNLDAILKKTTQKLNVLIDIDPEVGRTGVAFHEALKFAKSLQHFSMLKLKGIQCYAGNLQHIQNYQERFKRSTELMTKAARVMQQLKENDMTMEIFSGSGTGTYQIDLNIAQLTEVQPGSYTVMDAEYSAIGTQDNPSVNQHYQPALTLLTSVISVNHASQVTCDAGWKALYETPTKPIVLNPMGLAYDWFGDEHGKITSTHLDELPRLGDPLELIVGHCDPTINLFDIFYVTENDKVVDIWPIEMRGKSQ